jgi:formate dehydrogenase maturation protein FdhE
MKEWSLEEISELESDLLTADYLDSAVQEVIYAIKIHNELVAMLKCLEWSVPVEHSHSGRCPICGGRPCLWRLVEVINNSITHTTYQGHIPDCALAALLKKAEEKE